MYTKSEILERVDYLQTESPAMAAPLFEELNAALEEYFHRDEIFTSQVKYNIHCLTYDTELRSHSYVNSENMPIMSDNYPNGFEDVTILFTAAIDKELAGLKTIAAFCEGCGYDVGLAMYYEDYFEANDPYKAKDYSKNDSDIPAVDKKGIAKKIFDDGGYGWIKDTFELEMYVPSCLES